jgi:hypothetical protein
MPAATATAAFAICAVPLRIRKDAQFYCISGKGKMGWARKSSKNGPFLGMDETVSRKK